MASFVALMYNAAPAKGKLGCEIYCIFSNMDDSAFKSASEQPESIAYKLRVNGQVALELEGRQPMEQQLLTDIFQQAYGDEADIAMRKVRP